MYKVQHYNGKFQVSNVLWNVKKSKLQHLCGGTITHQEKRLSHNHHPQPSSLFYTNWYNTNIQKKYLLLYFQVEVLKLISSQLEQHPILFSTDESSLTSIVWPLDGSVVEALPISPASTDLLLTIRYIWESTSVKALSTFVASNAEVSMKYKDSLSANDFPSSVGTRIRCRKSHLLPISITTMFGSVWSLNSFNHLAAFSNVGRRVTSYTSKAPTAPR